MNLLNWNDYKRNQFEIINTIIEELRKNMDILMENFIFKTLLFLLIIGLFMSILVELLRTIYLQNERDKEKNIFYNRRKNQIKKKV